MAILAELFLVLAGYNSGISQTDNIHPAELEIFSKAARFGKYVATVNDITSSRLDNPVCRVVKRDVAFRYLEELAELEALIISQVSKYSARFDDSLLYTTRILALTADKWSEIFEFAVEMLARLDESETLLADWITKFILRNASYAGLRELGSNVLMEMDFEWISELKLVLTEGRECRSAFLDHIQAPDPVLVDDVARSMQKLIKAADTDPTLLESVLDLVESNETIIEQIQVPLNNVQSARVLKDIQQNVSEVVKTHFFRTPEVSSMLQLLRSVVLLGSSCFVTDLCDTHGDTERALDTYFEIDKELETVTLTHGPRLLSASSSNPGAPMITPVRIMMVNALEFVFTADQCIVYESLYVWLAKLAIASDSIGIGNGSIPHAYKLLFNTIWSHYQERIDIAFSRLDRIVRLEGGMNVRAEQDRILRTLVADLFLDSREYRKLLDDALVNCGKESLDPFTNLVRELNRNQERHTMDLRPFTKISDPENQ